MGLNRLTSTHVFEGLWAPNTKIKYWSKIISVERFHNDCVHNK